MLTILRLLVITGACLLGGNQACANCLPGVPTPTIYVGSDNQCNFATIQAAIDSVSTTATCAPNIVISAEHAWTAQKLTITNRSLSLIGSASGCGIGGTTGISGAIDLPAATPTSPQVTISGAGQTSATVISVLGNSHVTLQYLEVTGGNVGSDQTGGGLYFEGTGALTLDTVTVDHNKAEDGAGIEFIASGGSAVLTLKHYSLIINNTALTDGGGIRIQGPARLFMLEDASTVAFNAAGRCGGGIDILGPARADIGSSGAFVTGAVSNNTASCGGGISIFGSAQGSATARLFSTNAAQPVLISDNVASSAGGGIYLAPDAQNNVNTAATLCAYNFRIDDNSAPQGAAIDGWFDAFTNTLFGSNVYLNPSGDCGLESPASLGSVACAAGVPCNEISANTATNAQLGAVILMYQYEDFIVERLTMRDNDAVQMIYANRSLTNVGNYLHDCLIADNHSKNELIHSDSGASGVPLAITNCTFANNTIDSGASIYAAALLTLTDSIIDQPGVLAIDHEQGSCANPPCLITANYLMSNDITTLPVSNKIIAIDSGDPLFVDAANGNYHLQALLQNGHLTATRAIDFAPMLQGDSATDLDGNPYGLDMPSIPDFNGLRDLGAYEAQPITSRIFADGLGDAILLAH